MLYEIGGSRGATRYLFLHGNHARYPLAETVTIEAEVVFFDTQGSMLFGKDSPNQHRFTNGSCTHINDQEDAYFPARSPVEKLLKSVSVPTLLLIENPTEQSGIDFEGPSVYIILLVLGRSDAYSASVDDRSYLTTMMQGFVPRFVQSISPISDEYLPGNVSDLCKRIAGSMESIQDANDPSKFLELYHHRYMRRRSPVDTRAVLEICLLHILKMPFELSASIGYGLILN